jgi:hypothetical protein
MHSAQAQLLRRASMTRPSGRMAMRHWKRAARLSCLSVCLRAPQVDALMGRRKGMAWWRQMGQGSVSNATLASLLLLVSRALWAVVPLVGDLLEWTGWCW